MKYIRLILTGLLLCNGIASAQNQRTLDFVMLSNIFPEADSKDMQISFEMWATELFKDGGLNYDINLVIISPEDYIDKKYNLDRTFIVVISSINYLKTRNDRKLEPLLFTSEDTSQTYLIVADNSFNNLEELRDKNFSLTSSGFGEIAEFWVDYLIGSEMGVSTEEYFGHIDSLKTESKCINSVFFKNTEACAVREEVYNLACELNPQIKNRTRIIKRSPQLLHSIFCLTGKFTKTEREKFIKAVRNAQNTERGQQILNLFKRTKIYEYKNYHLKNTEDIYNSKIMSSYRR